MILIDYNQVCIASFMSQVGNHTNMKIDEDLMRHMILNTIRMIRVKFHEQYGEVVMLIGQLFLQHCTRYEMS